MPFIADWELDGLRPEPVVWRSFGDKQNVLPVSTCWSGAGAAGAPVTSWLVTESLQHKLLLLPPLSHGIVGSYVETSPTPSVWKALAEG